MSVPQPSSTSNLVPFDLSLSPTKAQQKAIGEIIASLSSGGDVTVLKGVTGSGKTMVAASVISSLATPTLLIAPNKTLAAQLTSEMQSLLPTAAVEYFVSYYDYYQPEAYLPSRDLYIEKESQINEEIDRLRHRATAALLTRKDVVIVASVSCIYGLGSPGLYKKRSIALSVGQTIDDLAARLVELGYTRRDRETERGQFRVAGESVFVYPSSSDEGIRIVFNDRVIESLSRVNAISSSLIEKLDQVLIVARTHYALNPDRGDVVISNIAAELKQQVAVLKKRGMDEEAQRLLVRTNYDLELLKETGFCSGIENYSSHLDERQRGERPWCLLDYFPDDFLTILDESHLTAPQIRSMSSGDRSRKETLIQHGFRLPSALDNRPQTFEEFISGTNQILCLSATPGVFENDWPQIDLIYRPTAIVDPQVSVRPRENQMDDLLGEIRARVLKNERVLITCLTKKMAEKMAEFLATEKVKSRFLHSDVATLDRITILRDLRAGRFDVLVGVNLLREGLDLPEVSLIAILDADSEGFLRGTTSLIQTIGRAARHCDGQVIMYADKKSQSMKEAIDETDRRRAAQAAYNKKHNLTPRSIIKEVAVAADVEQPEDIESKMLAAAENLDFEEAARLRDLLRKD